MRRTILIERGVRVPRMEIAKKLCKALVVRLDDIWGNGEGGVKE